VRADRVERVGDGIGWLRRHIDRFALTNAARAAIVMPAAFFFADKVIDDPDSTLFAAFGSFAILVLADFGGPRRVRLVAYLVLAAAGMGLIALGTLCSQEPWLAVAGMAVIGFAILFSRVINGYFASAAFAAQLLFIIPVAVPGPISAIPARLEGFALAAGAGILAKFVLWPSRPFDGLRAAAARACRTISDLVDPDLPADGSEVAARSETAGAAVRELRRSFVSSPDRPTGPTGRTEALAFLVDAADVLYALASPGQGRRPDPCAEENREVSSATAAVLRASTDNLNGRGREPDLERLDSARDAVEGALARRVEEMEADQDSSTLLDAAQQSFRMREISLVAREVAVSALAAVGAGSSGRGLSLGSTARATWSLIRAHATPRSASLRNSVRGAIGLAAAVTVIETASVQRGFWIVLATLSVLRYSALGTWSTIFSALAGTVVGIVVGGLLVHAIGTEEAVLWVVLPEAVLVAAYAPRAISFAAGQAGFTVTVLIIFNLIVPAGWEIGLVRIEDVAIGSGISLVVGVLFWPRGVESLVRASVGAAYRRAADYVAAAARRLVATEQPEAAEDALEAARAQARSAASRLDDAYRQYLADTALRRADPDRLELLITRAVRVRLAAYSMSTLTPVEHESVFDRCAGALSSEADRLDQWYRAFADALGSATAIPSPEGTDSDGGPVIRCMSDSLGIHQGANLDSALTLLWADQHLDGVWALGAELVGPAAELCALA
jgi:uncharacterized membrane protein YccC